MHCLKLAGRNNFIRTFFFLTFPMKINSVRAAYKPLKNCGLCEFTTTWDWKELPNGLKSVPCNHDKCTVDVQVQELHRQSWHEFLWDLSPKTLNYNALLQHAENMKHEIKAVMSICYRKKAIEAGERGGKELQILSLNKMSSWPEDQSAGQAAGYREGQWSFIIWCRDGRFLLTTSLDFSSKSDHHWQLHPCWQNFHFWSGHCRGIFVNRKPGIYLSTAFSNQLLMTQRKKLFNSEIRKKRPCLATAADVLTGKGS